MPRIELENEIAVDTEGYSKLELELELEAEMEVMMEVMMEARTELRMKTQLEPKVQPLVKIPLHPQDEDGETDLERHGNGSRIGLGVTIVEVVVEARAAVPPELRIHPSSVYQEHAFYNTQGTEA